VTRPQDPRDIAANIPSAGIAHLARTAVEYGVQADAYPAVNDAAARAEAAHKTARAKAILRARADGCRSMAEAEVQAEADDHIADLLMTRLTTRAKADAHLEKLRQLRSQSEAARSYQAAERELDRFHSSSAGQSP